MLLKRSLFTSKSKFRPNLTQRVTGSLVMNIFQTEREIIETFSSVMLFSSPHLGALIPLSLVPFLIGCLGDNLYELSDQVDPSTVPWVVSTSIPSLLHCSAMALRKGIVESVSKRVYHHIPTIQSRLG